MISTIRIKDLDLEIDGNQILDNINLEISNSGINCILGPNGAGKSMLSKTLALLQSPSSGHVFWNDKELTDFTSLENRRRVSYMWQKPIFLSMSAMDNIILPLKLRGLSDIEAKNHVVKLAELMDLTRLLELNPHKLSGGQKQKLSLLRSLAIEPELLILDEPTSSLDPSYTQWFENFMNEYYENFKPMIIWITHDIFQAQRISEKVFVIHKGTILSSGILKDLINDNSNTLVYNYLHGRLL